MERPGADVRPKEAAKAYAVELVLCLLRTAAVQFDAIVSSSE